MKKVERGEVRTVKVLEEERFALVDKERDVLTTVGRFHVSFKAKA